MEQLLQQSHITCFLKPVDTKHSADSSEGICTPAFLGCYLPAWAESASLCGDILEMIHGTGEKPAWLGLAKDDPSSGPTLCLSEGLSHPAWCCLDSLSFVSA